MYSAQQVKRSGAENLVVILLAKDVTDLTALRTFGSVQSWATHRFADKTSGADVTVEHFEEQTNQHGHTTVTLQLRQQRISHYNYGLPAQQAEQQVRQLLTGTAGPWSSLPQEVQGGVVALAARLSTTEVERYALLLAMYYLHKLQLVESIREFSIKKNGRQYTVKLEADVDTGAFSGTGKTRISLNERVSA